jgi:hypothetical protein
MLWLSWKIFLVVWCLLVGSEGLLVQLGLQLQCSRLASSVGACTAHCHGQVDNNEHLEEFN